MHRLLVRAYGLKFIISVDGRAGKFDFVTLLVKLGSGLGLLGLATLLADFVLLYFTSNKEVYREIKQLKFSVDQDKEIGVN
jgi:P2X purinoceptor 4